MGTEEQTLQELVSSDTGMLDMSMFSDMVDLFMYLPNKEKVNDHYSSPLIHSALSNNMKTQATAQKSNESPAEIHLRSTMEFIWIKIQERFSTISPAFRFFDKTMNGCITFDQFVMALEVLKVKLQSKDLLLVFNHLDSGKKGYLDYSDFCNLSDDKRINDPAAAML